MKSITSEINIELRAGDDRVYYILGKEKIICIYIERVSKKNELALTDSGLYL